MILDLVADILELFVLKIRSGLCKMSTEQQVEVLKYLGSISEPNELMSKQECCDYLGVSRATFDNHVKDGHIPHGFTKGGLLKFWNKIDIDIYLATNYNLEKL